MSSESARPVYAVIVAGGSGIRMGTAIPKQFLELEGKPVLAHTIAAFVAGVPEMHIVLVLPQEQLSWAQIVLQAFPERMDMELVVGGANRFESVKAGLSVVPEDAIVLVHDGVRCLVTPDLIRRCVEGVEKKGNAVPVVPVADSIREVGGSASRPVDRAKLRAVQTPQAFSAGALQRAFKRLYEDRFTDEATVWEAAGGVVNLVEGDRSNLKITTPEDLILAGAILRNR